MKKLIIISVMSGLIALNGLAQINTKNDYDHTARFDDNLIWTYKDGKKGMIDKSGTIIIPNEYDEITDFKDGAAWTYKDGQKGMIDISGKVIIPNIYDEITAFKNGYAWIYVDGKKGRISKDGKVVIPNIYDEIIAFKDSMAWTYKDGLKGIIELTGNTVIPNEYDEIIITNDGKVKAYKGDESFTIKNIHVPAIHVPAIHTPDLDIPDLDIPNFHIPVFDNEELVGKDSSRVLIKGNELRVSSKSGEVVLNNDSLWVAEKTASGTDTTRILFKKGKILIIKDKKHVGLHRPDSIDYDWEEEYYDDHKFHGNWSGVEMGMNNYLNKNFEMDLPQDGKLLDLNTGQSWQFNINFMHKSFGIYSDRFGLVTGLGIALNNYRFDKQVVFLADSSPIQFTLDTVHELKKNKLILTYLTLPILLEYQIPFDQARIHFAAGVIGSVKIGSRIKQVYENDERHVVREDFHISPFKVEATARIGYGPFNLFANYSLIPLFEKNKGPELYPFTVGLGLTF
ncbi:MAG: WG repeat-containing protein [Bacteroidia bacterium]|nr:WG repeat-containing protein [Bacteroidia bacterium]